jgi:hypothetical protein
MVESRQIRNLQRFAILLTIKRCSCSIVAGFYVFVNITQPGCQLHAARLPTSRSQAANCTLPGCQHHAAFLFLLVTFFFRETVDSECGFLIVCGGFLIDHFINPCYAFISSLLFGLLGDSVFWMWPFLIRIIHLFLIRLLLMLV